MLQTIVPGEEVVYSASGFAFSALVNGRWRVDKCIAGCLASEPARRAADGAAGRLEDGGKGAELSFIAI